MSDIAIKVENLSKLYHIGAKKSGSLRETISHSFNKFIGKKDDSDKAEEFWALKDINFEIKKGEAVGIIGRNGAGKSTLLKILSRITEPTTGKITVNGRVASLLEVGTGFHHELTGRENIFMNGAILGMKQVEINSKFDEIVGFSGIEKFIDTPVKHYSSGMYVRLAFAVAAHLEPEILIIDEVLAVGDAEFQKKCLGKMNDVATKEGRTVIFVSHSMPMIASLCSKAILIDSGKISSIGNASEVVLLYSTDGKNSPARVDFTKTSKKIGDDYAELLEGYVKNTEDMFASQIDKHESIKIGMKFKVLENKSFFNVFPYPNANLFSFDGTHILYTTKPNCELRQFDVGVYNAEFTIPKNFLNVGAYTVGLAFSSCDKDGVKIYFYEPNALTFQVTEQISDTLYNQRNGWSGELPGLINPSLHWNLSKVNSEELKPEFQIAVK